MRIGATTAREIINETCIAVWEVLSPIYLMTNPTPEKWRNIAEQFEKLWNYPNVCGSVDGKHIRIQLPYHGRSSYYNYKHYNSIVLQAVVDAEGNFLFVDVGAAGRHSDEGVFTASNFGKNFIEQTLNLPRPRKIDPTKEILFPYVFLADSAYSLNKNMMKPFARSSLTSDRKNIYNYRHSRARWIVECAFGMMSKKFHILQRPMLVHPDFATIITLACCVLHNMIRKKEGIINDVHSEMINVEECDVSREPIRAIASRNAYQVRENFVDYFISPIGSVSWQEFMARL